MHLLNLLLITLACVVSTAESRGRKCRGKRDCSNDDDRMTLLNPEAGDKCRECKRCDSLGELLDNNPDTKCAIPGEDCVTASITCCDGSVVNIGGFTCFDDGRLVEWAAGVSAECCDCEGGCN